MEKTSSMNAEKKKRRALIDFILYVIVVFAAAFFIILFVGQRTVVSGSSMQPTLNNGDNLIVDKLTYRFQEPERFDIIVFPYQDGTYYIKRIIGLPGETVRIDEEGSIYINGERLQESYGKEVIKNPGCAIKEITLDDDSYFVLGDNRNKSMDSRDKRVGLIRREAILGKARWRIYPFTKIGTLDG